MRRILPSSIAVVTALLFWSKGAAAQPDDRRAAAQLLFEQGRTLVEAGKFGEACPKFAESMRLDQGLGTSLWLADCYENAGQTASAWAQFKEAAASAALARDTREKLARERAAKLEARLSRLKIVVPKATLVSNLEIKRDGVVMRAAELDIPLPVDPGAHVIVAAAPGFKTWTSSVTVPPTPDTVSITLAPLERDPNATPPKQLPERRESQESPPSAGLGPQRTIGLVVAGAGLVSVGAGVYFGLHANSLYDSSKADGHCLADNGCDATGKSRRADAFTNATIATITIGVGAGALVGGALLYFLAPRESSVSITPSVGPHYGSMIIGARF